MQKLYRLTLYKVTFVLLVFFLYSTAAAQHLPVTIKILSSKKEPVAFASVTLTSRADTTAKQTVVSDTTGQARFARVQPGLYTVSITSVNYQPLEKTITVTEGKTIFSFPLDAQGKTLDAVVVTSKKPLMRQEDDKTIVEPENLAAISTNGYEMLEKTPGLFVDQDGNIYINSLTPAAIQINGRDMKMSTQDIATLLKNLPPNSIARLEIVRTPSARYDASGTGGVVNVVLKKGVKLGMTGSVTAGMQQGTYGNQFLGFNLNNNNGKTSYNLNMSVGSRNSFERINTSRNFAPDSLLSQDAYTKYPGKTAYAAFSANWELNKKWDITYDADLNYNNYHNRSENRNQISKISTGQLLTNSLNTVDNDGYSLSVGTGFESKYKIDTTGSEWTNDTYFTHNESRSDQVFASDYLSPALPSSGGDGNGNSSRNYFTGRSDLKLKLKKKLTVETGIQSTLNIFRNETEYYKESSGIRSKDGNRTNTFRFSQNINSFYLQASKTIGKDFIAKFGTRLENTNMDGHQTVPGDTTFSIHRTDLFPYIYLSKPLMKIAGYELRAYIVYRRSIRRPSYDQLNPFRRYVDEFLTETGNPSLRPQFTNNYEFNVSVDETPVFAVGINDSKDIFSNVVYQSDTSRSQALRTYDNTGRNKEWYLRGMGALPPGKKYFFVLGAQYNHNTYEGLYEGKPLSFSRGTWTLFTFHSLKLDKKSSVNMHGFVRFKGQQGFYELSSFGALNLSINRKFIKDKLTVTASMNDIFYSNKNNFTIRQGSVDAYGYRLADTRRFGINLRYNFGIRKKEENNNKMMDMDSQSNRP
ncbi:MAG: outer membrane beta-barrel protein [Chitinophagaceae bacterium]